jgi:hypothetical protein
MAGREEEEDDVGNPASEQRVCAVNVRGTMEILKTN